MPDLRRRARCRSEIAGALHVAHLLGGSVRRVESRIRAKVQLIDTRSDTQVGGEGYERDVTDVFALQTELAERIASELRVVLSPSEKAAIETRPTLNADAYNLYLRAKELMFAAASAKEPEAEVAKAIELLNEAVTRDPSFAFAYCLLARAHVDLFYNHGRSLHRHVEEARAAVEAALRLAPDSGEAHFANAFYLFHGLDDPPHALADFAIATRKMPNNADARSWMGILERRMGHWREAVRDLTKATELDPHNGRPPIDLIVCYEMLRNYREADQVIERALIAIPGLTNRFRARQAEIALAKGDTQACRAILDSLPNDYKQGGGLAYIHAKMHLWNRDYGAALRALDEIPAEELTGFTGAWVARDRSFIMRAQGDRVTLAPVLQYAIDLWQARLGETADGVDEHSYLAMFYAAADRKGEAIAESQKAVDLRPLAKDATNAPTMRTRQAMTYVWCGERERALEQLESLSKLPGGPSLGDLKLNPAWDSVRDEPRFQKLITAAAEPIKL